MEQKDKSRKQINWSNIITAILSIAILVMFFKPGFKAEILKGLAKTGMFQPSLANTHQKTQLSSATFSNKPILFEDQLGKQIDLNSLKGKVVFLNFWATWCPPCIAEMPSINDLYLQYRHNPNIVFLMVNADGDFNQSKRFVIEHKFNFPIYASRSKVPTKIYNGTLPTTIIVDKGGNIVYHREGMSDYSNKDFLQYMEKLTSNNL